MITLKEIAKKCSVSIATVSNILNGKSNVSEDTKQRVLQVVKETGYRPNYMARTLRAHKTNTIGLIIDDLTSFSSPMIVNGIMACCEENNYKAILENLRLYSRWSTNWQPESKYKNLVEEAIDKLLAIKVDGIIYIAAHSYKIESIPKDLSVPFVIAYAYADYPNIPCIMLDDEKSAYEMTKHLIQNANKKIAVIAGNRESVHTQFRLKGYKKALSEAQISYDENIIYFADWQREGAFDSCNNLLENHKDCDAIFCFNDVMAAGAYESLKKHKLQPGKDISVVGFDNREFINFMDPPLTTMTIQLFKMGFRSAYTMIDIINGKPLKEIPLNQYVPCELNIKESVVNKN